MRSIPDRESRSEGGLFDSKSGTYFSPPRVSTFDSCASGSLPTFRLLLARLALVSFLPPFRARWDRSRTMGRRTFATVPTKPSELCSSRRAPDGAFASILTQMGGAPSGRVRGGLRLSSRFQLHAGRQEARKRDGSLGNASNKDVTRDERGKASRRGDIRITEKTHPIIKFMRCVSTFGSENANGTLWSDVWWV